MIVLDASAAVDLLLRIEPQASQLSARLDRPGESVHAPFLLDAEVLQALRRHVQRRFVSATRAGEVLGDLRDLRITRYPYLSLMDRMWALRDNLSAFDAAYVALAEVLDAPLITSDARLARAPGISVPIEVFR